MIFAYIKGKLEDTVIALFADHYPYGLTNKQINSYLDYNVNGEYKNGNDIRAKSTN